MATARVDLYKVSSGQVCHMKSSERRVHGFVGSVELGEPLCTLEALSVTSVEAGNRER